MGVGPRGWNLWAGVLALASGSLALSSWALALGSWMCGPKPVWFLAPGSWVLEVGYLVLFLGLGGVGTLEVAHGAWSLVLGAGSWALGPRPWLLELCSCTLGVGSGALDLDPWVWALGPGISDLN